MEESSPVSLIPTEFSKHSEKKWFTCNVCSRHFSKPPKPFSCEICGVCFRKSFTLKKHKYTHKKFKVRRNSKDKNNYQQNGVNNITQKHTSDNGQEGVVAKNTHIELKPYLCQICLQCFTEENALRDHSNIHNGESLLTIDKTLKQDHCSEGKQILVCDICNEQLSDQDALKIHCKAHVEEKPYTCQICQLCFKDEKAFQDHNIHHSNDNRHCCETCGKKFSDKKEFEIHCRVHKSFIPQNGVQNQCNLCKICGKTFADDKSLEIHQQEHTQGKLYAELLKHQQMHEDKLMDIERENYRSKEPTRFFCNTCGQSFCQDHLMRLHSLDHLKEYACNSCDKRFFNAKSLASHCLLHHKRPTHSCIVCREKFDNKNDLLLHCLSHVSGGEYFICSSCKCCFKQREELERHNPCFAKKES
ncbi:zinc finger protein [Nephila pilipes]|uniref:Zinc finger protein n=1 Tax=Nephila pilipes TaxID=299642 RepID=A0A8X6QE45_NEPPI|nr:zinc finger protein [Nephila pilipes]